MQRFRPVSQQQFRRSAALRALHVAHDAGQPGAEPVRVTQPVQGHERLQERFLQHVVHVIRAGAQPRRAGPGRCPVPLDEQPERGRVAGPRLPHQVAVFHTG